MSAVGGCLRWRVARPEQAASEPSSAHSWPWAGRFLQGCLLHTCVGAFQLSGPCCRRFIPSWSLPEAGLGERVCREGVGDHAPLALKLTSPFPSEESGKCCCLARIICCLLRSFEELRAPSRQEDRIFFTFNNSLKPNQVLIPLSFFFFFQ